MIRLFRQSSGLLPSVRLEAARVFLRPPEEDDWPGYAEIRSASRAFLEPWEPTWPADALSRDAFLRRLRRYGADWRDDSGYAFLIFARGQEDLIGGISVSNLRRGAAQCGTLGYWIGEKFSRNGLMTESLNAVLGFCFNQLSLHRVDAACLPSNEPSRRLLRRCGFEQEGFAPKYLKITGVWHDHMLFGLLADDFVKGRGGGWHYPKAVSSSRDR